MPRLMERFRIVTFNIAHARGLSPFPGLHGRRRFERNLRKIARLFDELKPDIVALQEIDENSRWSGSFDHLDYLRFFADFPHAVFGVNNRRVGGYHLNYGNAILSRHPIAAWENITFGTRTVGEKGFLFAEINLGGRLLPVVNLHLHYRSRVHRFRQLEKLMEYLNAKREHRRAHWAVPPILCGDLNNPSHRLDATASLFRYLSLHGRYTMHPPPGVRTYPSPWPQRSLDFIFLPPACRMLNCEVVRCYLSDHRPVMVEFGLKRPGSQPPM
jgi:endonuclease/exonuclease/phosphatase family metal-dependent hydrolase